MQNAEGGVKTEQKVYGKRGRRIRAKQRLEKQLDRNKGILEIWKKTLTSYEQAKKLDKTQRDDYTRILNMAADWSDKYIPCMEAELAILNSRI